MDSKRLKQTVNLLEKAISSWDFDKAIDASNDEATTRDFLIHPFFELLGYQRIDDFTHEYIADVGGKRGGMNCMLPVLLPVNADDRTSPSVFAPLQTLALRELRCTFASALGI